MHISMLGLLLHVTYELKEKYVYMTTEKYNVQKK